jgi:dGTP triphosphohydrolase
VSVRTYGLLSELLQIYLNQTTVERCSEREAVASSTDNQNCRLIVNYLTCMIVQYYGARWVLHLQVECNIL